MKLFLYIRNPYETEIWFAHFRFSITQFNGRQNSETNKKPFFDFLTLMQTSNQNFTGSHSMRLEKIGVVLYKIFGLYPLLENLLTKNIKHEFVRLGLNSSNITYFGKMRPCGT